MKQCVLVPHDAARCDGGDDALSHTIRDVLARLQREISSRFVTSDTRTSPHLGFFFPWQEMIESVRNNSHTEPPAHDRAGEHPAAEHGKRDMNNKGKSLTVPHGCQTIYV